MSGKIHISVFKMFLAFLLCAVADNYRLQPACEALLYEAAVLRLRWVFILLLSLIWTSHLFNNINSLSFLLHLPAQAPKVVKVFINLPRSMGFDDAERSEATQTLELTEEDYKEDGLIPLRYVKFQNVQSVTVRADYKQNTVVMISSMTWMVVTDTHCLSLCCFTSCLLSPTKETRRRQKSTTWHS